MSGKLRFRVRRPLENHQLLLLSHRQCPQQHGIYKTENCGVGSDAEGQGEHGDSGEAGGFAQHARSEAQILPQSLYIEFPGRGADYFLCDFQTPSLQPYGAKRILPAHPLLHLFLGRHLQEAV